jgi:hypothetical protein
VCAERPAFHEHMGSITLVFHDNVPFQRNTRWTTHGHAMDDTTYSGTSCKTYQFHWHADWYTARCSQRFMTASHIYCNAAGENKHVPVPALQDFV